MHPDLERLVALQRLDLELRRLREEIDGLPRHLASVAAQSAAAQGRLMALDQSLATEERLRRSLQSDVMDQTQRSARARRQMDVVTTSAQATALEHEIAFAEAEVRRLEDAEIESMERTEALDPERAQASADATSTELLLERERLRSAEVIATDTKIVAKLSGERSDLRPLIGEAILANYDRVSKAKGTGIAEGVDQRCSACQMMVRPQRWNDLRDRSNHETVLTCENCGRLLYWDPARDAPAKKSVQTVPGGGTDGKAEVR